MSLQRDKVVKKMAKKIAKLDNQHNEYESLRWSDEAVSDQKFYLSQADAALKKLGDILDGWDVVPIGLHDITADLVQFFKGNLQTYTELNSIVGA